jgi:hypothetical protein
MEPFSIDAGLIRRMHMPMKPSRWIVLAVSAVLVTSDACLSHRDPHLEKLVAPIPTANVSFRFVECAGNRSVFILDNQTSEPIYARVQHVDYWPEYRSANMQYGVHIVKYKSPTASDFVDRSDRFDAPPSFTTILPYSNIRYGVYLREQTGLYKIMVPYIENKDAELVTRMNDGVQALTKDDFKRLETAWKEAWSETAANRCK